MGRGGGLEKGSLAGEYWGEGGGGLFFFCLGFVFVFFALFLFCCWIVFGVVLFLVFQGFFNCCCFLCFVWFCLFCLLVLECFCVSCCVFLFCFCFFFVFVGVV